MAYRTFCNAQSEVQHEHFSDIWVFAFSSLNNRFCSITQLTLSLITQLIPPLFNQRGVFFSKHGKVKRLSYWTSRTFSGKDDKPSFTDVFLRWLGKRWVWNLYTVSSLRSSLFRFLSGKRESRETATQAL